jgi:hypothetical protein
MALHVLPDDGSIQNVQRRKQGGCAVALVIMGHGCPASLLPVKANMHPNAQPSAKTHGKPIAVPGATVQPNIAGLHPV